MMRCDDLAARISEALGEHSQSWLAHRMGVTQAAVSYWLGGHREPSLRTIERLALVLRVSPAWLAYGEGMMREPGRTDIPTATGGRHG